MLQIAESDRIGTIVATPHVFSIHNTIKNIEEIIKQTHVHSTQKNMGIESTDLLVSSIPLTILNNETIIDIGESRGPRKKNKILDFLRGMFR